jgi:hypothetical protein
MPRLDRRGIGTTAGSNVTAADPTKEPESASKSLHRK